MFYVFLKESNIFCTIFIPFLYDFVCNRFLNGVFELKQTYDVFCMLVYV